MTAAGVLFAFVTILLCIAALNTESNLLFLVFALCAAGPIINVVILLRRMRRLSVRRIAPAASTCGQTLTLRYELRAVRRFGRTYGVYVRETGRASADVRLADGYVTVVPASAPVVVETAGVTDRRGVHMLDAIQVESSMPFGLIRRVLETRVPQRLVVYPRLGTFDRPPLPAGGSSDSGSARAELSQRMPDEFFGLREYRIGDNPQWIHWRRSARTGELLVREMATRRAKEVLIVVDHRRSTDDADLERVISAAATLACDALERGYRVGLIGLAEDLLVLSPVAGRQHRERLLYELARLHGEPVDPPAAFMQRLRWPAGRGAMGVLFAAQDDADTQAAHRVLRSRCTAARLLLAGSPDFESSFRIGQTNGRARGIAK